MRTLGLDISTKTGYAVIDDGVLVSHGLKTAAKSEFPMLPEDFWFVARARTMGEEVYKLIVKFNPDKIVIEQTNLGRSRTDQKQLEFIHFEVLRRILGMERESQVVYVDTSKWRSILKIKLDAVQRAHNKNVKNGLSKGKVTPKHLAVAWANSKYGLDLLKKDHDIADAIALATYGQIPVDTVKPIDHAAVDKIVQDNKIVVS